MAEMIKIPVQDRSMDLYLGAPPRRGKGPAIVLMYHRDGIDAFTRGVVARLQQSGYLVAVPDVYHRCPPGTVLRERKSLLSDSGVVEDVEATMRELRKRPEVDAGRIVIMGHCMGGRMALLAAGRVAGFCAAVVFYGGGVERSWGNEPTTPFHSLRNIRCPIIGFFGDRGVNPSPDEVNRIDAELGRHGIQHRFHRYPNVGHGFQNPSHDTPEDRAAAEDAWTKTLSFLHDHAPV
jgi:carboxymethylenebutenolidase